MGRSHFLFRLRKLIFAFHSYIIITRVLKEGPAEPSAKSLSWATLLMIVTYGSTFILSAIWYLLLPFTFPSMAIFNTLSSHPMSLPFHFPFSYHLQNVPLFTNYPHYFLISYSTLPSPPDPYFHCLQLTKQKPKVQSTCVNQLITCKFIQKEKLKKRKNQKYSHHKDRSKLTISAIYLNLLGKYTIIHTIIWAPIIMSSPNKMNMTF